MINPRLIAHAMTRRSLALVVSLCLTRLSWAGTEPVPASFFGLHHHHVGVTNDYVQDPDPNVTVSFGSVRLWDTGTAWSDLEPSRGQFNWTVLDSWFARLKTTQQDVLYTIAVVPTWAASDTASAFNSNCRVVGGCTPPCDLSPGTACSDGSSSTSLCADGSQGNCRYKEYITALVTHSCLNDNTNVNSGSRCPSQPGRINAYELWNEPDRGLGSSDIEWVGSIAQMVTLARDASTIIRRLDPSAKIVTPSPTTTGGAPWLQTFLTTSDQDGQNNGNAYVDVVGFHAYLNTAVDPPTAEAVVSRIAEVKALTSKPVWDTESSWGATQVNGVLESRLPDLHEQAAFVAKDYLLHWSAGADRFYWYAWDGGPWGGMVNQTSGSSSWPLLDDAVAYAHVADWMIGSTLLRPCSQGTNTIWSCVMQDHQGNPQLAIWDSVSTVTFPVPAGYSHSQSIDGTITALQANQTLSVGSAPMLLMVPAAETSPSIAPALPDVRVYPNPWRQDKHSEKPVTFDNLPEGSSVKLFSTSGHHVTTLAAIGSSATWFLTNDSGDKVASGIYIYVITDGSGNKVRGKLAVIR